MADDAVISSPVSPGQARRWRALRIAAAVPFLAVIVDPVLLNWVSNATAAKDACYTPLPAYQNLVATLVPAAFVVLALGCLVGGVVRIVQGRRHRLAPERNTGAVTVALSLPGLITASTFGAAVWLAAGFSTWCF